MFYKQKRNVFIRIYDEVGYIINKSNLKSKITNKTGAVFLKSLSREPQLFSDLVKIISNSFSRVEIDVLTKDVKEFFGYLEEEGFIVSGETMLELENKDVSFSYLNESILDNSINKEINNSNFADDKTDNLENYFKNNSILIRVHIELTNRCNERCIHCYIPHECKNTDISKETFYNILQQCKKMGVLKLSLSGGEPLSHPHFIDFVKAAKEDDFSVNILSNLTLLTDELVDVLKSGSVSSIQTSLYSLDPEIHDFITKVKGSCEKTKAAIIKLIENDIPVQISCPIMKVNKHCFTDVFNWASERKIKAVTDYIMMARFDNSVSNLDYRLSYDDVECLIRNNININNDYKDKIMNSDYSVAFERDTSCDRLCSACTTSIAINSKGDVHPCAGWQSYVCGNINEESLEEIWNTSSKIKYIRNLRKKDFPKCIKCPNRLFCIICMARNANEDPHANPLNISEYSCRIAEINKKTVFSFIEENVQESIPNSV